MKATEGGVGIARNGATIVIFKVKRNRVHYVLWSALGEFIQIATSSAGYWPRDTSDYLDRRAHEPKKR